MALHWFNPPVYVTTDRPGLCCGVSHVEGAAEQLLKWTKRGPKWQRASALCLQALGGEEIDLKGVRNAFEAAAKGGTMPVNSYFSSCFVTSAFAATDRLISATIPTATPISTYNIPASITSPVGFDPKYRGPID
ncbi:MAG: DUF982 domain-containing protein [Mesorhizobium sp.]|nr:MAG: DUF982 domain-containing protein [Mesorhizobium sp.]